MPPDAPFYTLAQLLYAGLGGTAAAIVVLAFLGKTLISLQVDRVVRQENRAISIELEELRGKLRLSEEAFKTSQRGSELEMSALRESVAKGIQHRNSLVAQKSIDAGDILWKGVVALSFAKWTTALLSVLKIENIISETKDRDKLKEFFASMNKQDVMKIADTQNGVSEVRPYISDATWAYYEAYRNCVMSCATIVHMFANGIFDMKLIDHGGVTKLLKTALPESADYIDRVGIASYTYLLPDLEKKLMTELRNSIEGRETDAATLLRVEGMLQASNEIQAQKLKGQAEKATA